MWTTVFLAKFILYADDANIPITGQDIDEISIKFDTISRILVNWVGSNGHALNLKETKYMFFYNQNLSKVREFKIHGKMIPCETEARFLGVIVDEKQSWTCHIYKIRNKMAKCIGLMYKLKHFYH